jgi:hypothetical protein
LNRFPWKRLLNDPTKDTIWKNKVKEASIVQSEIEALFKNKNKRVTVKIEKLGESGKESGPKKPAVVDYFDSKESLTI